MGPFMTWLQPNPDGRSSSKHPCYHFPQAWLLPRPQVSVSPTKSLSPSSLSSSTLSFWKAGCTRAFPAPGSRAAQVHDRRWPLWCRAGKGWLGPLLSLLSRCLSRALGLHQGSQAEVPQVGANCQVSEGAETQACGRHPPVPATFPWPSLGALSPSGRCLAYSSTFPSHIFFKRTPLTPLLSAEGGPSSPPHVLFPVPSL